MSAEQGVDLPTAVRDVLRRVVDPCSIATGVPISIVDMGLVLDVAVEGSTARVQLCLTSPICFQITNILTKVDETVASVPGIEKVDCSVDAAYEWMPSMMAASSQRDLRAARPVTSTLVDLPLTQRPPGAPVDAGAARR
jgi:metal-sulfur cluster biosynthetic enzyme